ncbi:hypothetical protein [Rhodanobacter lindaniclasticus]|uniref:Uncharacterized protein n=1 Tax=Rhodanobacter lindaniclasticus TaxID=75310 RepID=A0A4S3KCJ2_9GAMM|nr:hypothetical protein [Rhodanobacter lindaniclasticus]THD06120.1 hypothetical protein B1991_14350 [Rhodanobacter lindaniclasticus]
MARIIPIWAYIILAALLAIGIQQWRVSHYKARVESLQSVANTLHEANVANQATIKALQAANDKWARESAANLANAKIYTDAAMAFAKKQQAEADAAKAKLRAIYERQPDAKAWADARVPDSVVRVLTSAGQD